MSEQFDIRFDESSVNLEARPQKVKKGTGDNDSAWFYLGMIGQIGLAIALPIAGGALLGAFIDNRFQWYPKATVSFIFVGAIVSIATLVGSVRDILAKENQLKKQKSVQK